MMGSSASEFWAMGGHGLFVWGSFGVALLLMVAEPLWALARRQAALQEPEANEFDEAPITSLEPVQRAASPSDAASSGDAP